LPALPGTPPPPNTSHAPSNLPPQEIATAVEMIKTCLGPLPLFKEREEGEGGEEAAPTSLPIPIQMAAARPAVIGS